MSEKTVAKRGAKTIIERLAIQFNVDKPYAKFAEICEGATTIPEVQEKLAAEGFKACAIKLREVIKAMVQKHGVLAKDSTLRAIANAKRGKTPILERAAKHFETTAPIKAIAGVCEGATTIQEAQEALAKVGFTVNAQTLRGLLKKAVRTPNCVVAGSTLRAIANAKRGRKAGVVFPDGYQKKAEVAA